MTCNVPAITANDGTASILLDLEVQQQGSVVLTASLPTAGDIDSANNTDSETTTVTEGADTRLDINDPATAAAGSIATYDLVLSNDGPDSVSDVVVEFPVPTGLINLSPPSGCNFGVGIYTCTVPGPIAAGGNTTISFGGQISAAASSTVTPVVGILRASIPDPVTANNAESFDTTVTGGSDLEISKTRSPSGSLLAGNAAVFTLDSQYTGDNPTGLTIVDLILANYAIDSIVPASGWDCTVNGQQVTCTLVGGSGPGANVALALLKPTT